MAVQAIQGIFKSTKDQNQTSISFAPDGIWSTNQWIQISNPKVHYWRTRNHWWQNNQTFFCQWTSSVMKSIISHNLWDFEALTRVAATIPATLGQQSSYNNNIQFCGLKRYNAILWKPRDSSKTIVINSFISDPSLSFRGKYTHNHHIIYISWKSLQNEFKKIYRNLLHCILLKWSGTLTVNILSVHLVILEISLSLPTNNEQWSCSSSNQQVTFQ